MLAPRCQTMFAGSGRPARAALDRPASVLERHDVKRAIAADRGAVTAVARKLHAEMHLVGARIDDVHGVPRRAGPAGGLAVAVPDQIVIVLRPLHDGHGSTVEADVWEVEPARTD